jgi:hypothetical protein
MSAPLTIQIPTISPHDLPHPPSPIVAYKRGEQQTTLNPLFDPLFNSVFHTYNPLTDLSYNTITTSNAWYAILTSH